MNDIKAKCCKGNPGVKVCSTSSCNAVGVICGDECECFKPHQNCMRISNIKSLFFHMQKKGQTLKPVFECLQQFYQKQKKQLETILAQIKSKIENTKNCLLDNEGKLYALLKQGKNQQIKGSIVHNTINALQSAPKFYVQNNIQFIKKYIEDISKQISLILLKMKQFENHKYFSNANSLEISKQKNGFISIQKHIQITNNILKNKTRRWNLILLQSPVQHFGDTIQTYKFKIKSTDASKYIILGLCHYNFALKCNFNGIAANNTGIYAVYGTNGSIYYHQVSQPQRQSNKIVNFDKDEIIHLKFTPSNSQLQITNLTKNQKDVIQTKLKQGDPLHPFITFWTINDQVQYLGIDLQ